jgi:type VI secretion system Hcp family effector
VRKEEAVGYTAYLKIDGLDGACLDPDHRHWYLIDGFVHSLSGPPAHSTAPSVSDFSISKLADRSTPQLARAAAQGRYFKEAVLELRETDGAKAKFMEIRFTKVRITSYSLSGAPQQEARAPYESFGLAFEKIEWACFPDPDQEGRADRVNEAAGTVN